MNCSIDLHIHSIYSDDGEFSPAGLVRQAQESGITVMAISDHNSVRANSEGQRAALAAGIAYIPAIEIDCVFDSVNFHLLGYGIDYESHDFAAIERNITEQCAAASKKMLAATRTLGFDVTETDLQRLSEHMFWSDHWTGEMFAEVLLDKPEYLEHPLLLPYRHGGTRSDNPYVNFYWDYYSQGKPCYVAFNYPPLTQAVEIIHRNGGKAVLAHPGANLKEHMELLDAICTSSIDGLEAFSSYHSPAQADYFYREAAAHGLFVTCGSDYHGKTKPSIALRQHGCTLEDQRLLDQLGMQP